MHSIRDGRVEVHVTKNGQRYWQLYYTDPVSRRRRWRSTGTESRRDAERQAVALEAEIAAGMDTGADRLTWDDFRDRFRDEHLSARADKTFTAYETALNRFEDAVDPARLSTITPSSLSQFAAQLRRDGLASTSIATYLRHLRSAFAWAVDTGLMPAVPKCPRADRDKRDSLMRSRPITGEELDRILAAVPQVVHHDVPGWQRYLQALYDSGLRLGESIALSWDPTDPFTVEHSDFWYLRIYSQAQKSRRDQLLPIAPEFAAILESTPPAARRGQVFPLLGRHGRPLRTAPRVGDLVRKITSVAHVRTSDTGTASPHDFRRSFGSRWATRVTPPELQQLMRHRSIQTTLTYYVRLESSALAAKLSRKVNDSVNDSIAASRFP